MVVTKKASVESEAISCAGNAEIAVYSALRIRKGPISTTLIDIEPLSRVIELSDTFAEKFQKQFF